MMISCRIVADGGCNKVAGNHFRALVYGAGKMNAVRLYLGSPQMIGPVA